MTSLSDMLASIAVNVFVYMTAWFVLALILKRRDVVDSAWGLGFIVVAASAFSQRNNESIFTTVALVLVSLWGARLFLHITTRNWKKKEDFRYQDLGELGTFKLWLRAYTNVFLMQGALMILISLPVVAIMHADNYPLNSIAIIGAIVWLYGIVFETIGDYQLRQFIKTKKKGEIMQTGLWRYTRHPNYYGEVTAWWGAAIIALAYGQWWGIIGAVVISVLILKISGVPLLEKKYASDPAFQKYVARTSIFLPLPPKKS